MPHMPLVAITDYIQQADVEAPILEGIARVQCLEAHDTGELRGRLSNVDVIICFHEVRITADLLRECTQCIGVVRGGVGFDNVDRQAAGQLGIPVCNVPDYGTEEVADHALGLLIALTRRFIPSIDSIRNGHWQVSINEGSPRLRGRTIGVIGAGRIGTAFIQRVKVLGIRVVFYDPYASRGFEKALGVDRAWSLDELFPQCDFLSIHCPLTEETRHMVDAAALAKLPPGAYLINTARGGVVDENALIDSLNAGHLAGAAIDVFEREPLTDERFRQHPRVIATPHCAFYSVEAAVEMRTKAAEEARRLLLGIEPRNLVNSQFLDARLRRRAKSDSSDSTQ